MDLASVSLIALIVVYGFVQYRRREQWYRDALLLTTRGTRTIVFSRTLEMFHWILAAGTMAGLFLVSGLAFMIDELKGRAPKFLLPLLFLLGGLLLLLAVLIIVREARLRRKGPARRVDKATGMPR